MCKHFDPQSRALGVRLPSMGHGRGRRLKLHFSHISSRGADDGPRSVAYFPDNPR